MRDSTDWNGERIALERSSMWRVTAVLKNTLFVSVVGGVEGGVVERWHVMGEGSWVCSKTISTFVKQIRIKQQCQELRKLSYNVLYFLITSK